MKIRIDIQEDIEEDEIIIRCKNMNTSVQKIYQAISDTSSRVPKLIFFKEEDEYYIPLEDLLFFETSGSRIHAHTKNESYLVKSRLYELEEMLPKQFIRVSKSTIINVDHIFSISRNLTSSSLIQFYTSHKQVYVSRLYYKTLRQRLDERRNYEK